MPIHKDILAYNAAQSVGDKAICDALAKVIDQQLKKSDCKIWHRHPVWFLDGNPIVGYHKLKDCVRLLFWSGQSFDEPGLAPEGSFKAAEARYTSEEQISAKDLKRWLKKAIEIQWDYKNIVKRKGRLQRLKLTLRQIMNPDDPLDLEHVDEEIRINELREQARELAGGEMTVWENPDIPADLAEGFWSNVVAFERALQSCDFLRLEEMGVALPPPADITDEELPRKLREILETLARVNTFFIHTDHYSDRELYTHLWEESLREIKPIFPPEAGFNCTYGLVSSGSEDDTRVWLKYYADEETRQQWAKDFPDDEVPPHLDPPYDRDRHLPKHPMEWGEE